MGRGTTNQRRRTNNVKLPRKIIKSDWIQHSVAIETRYTRAAVAARKSGKSAYDDDRKTTDPIKNRANSVVCAYTLDLHNYYRSIIKMKNMIRPFIRNMRYLVLDALYLGTTTRLVNDCGVPLSNIYVCSNEIEFRGHINSFTGRLVDYLLTLDPNDVKFDVLFLDFCGNLSKENLEALELLFKKRLLDVVGILAITLSYRNGNKSAAYNREHTFGGLMKLKALALKYGYYIGLSEPVENVKHGMCTYVCKFLDFEDAMHHREGFNLDGENLGPDNWVNRSVPILHKIINNDEQQVEEMDHRENEEQQVEEMDHRENEEVDEQEDEEVEEQQTDFQVGDDVSVRLTGLLNFSGFRHCHMDGKIISIDQSKFNDIYEVHLLSINDTIRVHYDRLTKVRGATMGRMWKEGDYVQIYDGAEWWEASIMSYNARTKLYTIEWAGYGNTAEVSADKIRK
jgi:hypothetical protein